MHYIAAKQLDETMHQQVTQDPFWMSRHCEKPKPLALWDCTFCRDLFISVHHAAYQLCRHITRIVAVCANVLAQASSNCLKYQIGKVQWPSTAHWPGQQTCYQCASNVAHDDIPCCNNPACSVSSACDFNAYIPPSDIVALWPAGALLYVVAPVSQCILAAAWHLGSQAALILPM